MNVLLLFGGTSVIGSRLSEGLCSNSDNTEIVRVSRNSLTNQDEIHDFFASPNSDELVRRITHVVLSVGAPEREISADTAWEGLRNILEVNVFKSVRFLELLLERRKHLLLGEIPIDIHLVSSVLADFIKPGAVDYSISKQVLDTKIQHLSMVNNQRLFVWRFGFVRSPFHPDGETRSFEATASEIFRRARKAKQPGIYYVPRGGRGVGYFLAKAPRFVVSLAARIGGA